MGPATGDTSRGSPVESWSLGGPIAEAVSSEAGPSEKALERRTRRIHCGQPCDNPAGAECFLSVWPFDFACVQHGWVEKSQAGRRSRRTDTGSLVGITEVSVVGLAMRLSGIGARCVQKSSFVRGSPPKTGVREVFQPVPGLF